MINVNKQALHDLQRKIGSSVHSLLSLMKEGNPEQAMEVQQRAKMDFLKIAPRMEKTAQALGEKYALIVQRYLNTVDLLFQSKEKTPDPHLIHQCNSLTDQLEKELKLVA